MKVKYCLPIIKSKQSEVLKIISENQNSYDFFEVWLDYIQNLDITKFHSLEKIVFLFRRQNLETSVMNFETRKKIMDVISGSGCYLDLDLSQKEDLEYAKTKDIPLILSYHNYSETPDSTTLNGIIKQMSEFNPVIYKISTFCKTKNYALRLLSIAVDLKEKNIKFIVLGMGENGEITRIQGTQLGNEMIFAPLLLDERSAEGQITLEEYKKIFSDINTQIKICSYIGDPAEHSLSPLMHSIGYKKLSIQNEFIYISRLVTTEQLAGFIKNFRINSQYVGLSVGLPHKQKVMQYLDEIDEVAKIIGAVNTVVKENGRLKGFNTDYLGILTPLKEKRKNLQDKTTAIVGSGGAARAAVYALTKEGTKVTIFNRDVEKAKKLSVDFNCEYDLLDNISRISDFDIVINATPVGMKHDDLPIIPGNLLKSNQIVFDIVYPSTPLIDAAKKQGAKNISGLEMLLYQGVAQFELFTGKKAPVEEMRKALI